MAYYQNNQLPTVTRNILIINGIIWLLCSFIYQPLMYYLALFNAGSGYFKVYQLVTYMFTHVEFTHFFFNMFALYMFGAVIENYWGKKRYLIYYLTTGIGAGLVQLLVCYLHGIYDPTPTIGASGAVFGLLLAFGMLFPNAPLYLMFIPIPIKAKYMVIGYGLLEFFYGVANRSGDNVAHFAHLGGMLFGIILILYWRKNAFNYTDYRRKKTSFLLPLWQKIKNIFRKEPEIYVKYRRPETDQEYNARKNNENAEIDRILDKIKYSGYNSLTDAEKKKLFDAGKS